MKDILFKIFKEFKMKDIFVFRIKKLQYGFAVNISIGNHVAYGVYVEIHKFNYKFGKDKGMFYSPFGYIHFCKAT
jgi:hypothetical protein